MRREFNSPLAEFRFMINQNYYPLLRKRYKEHPLNPIKEIVTMYRKYGHGLLLYAFNWDCTLERHIYWSDIYHTHYFQL